MSEPIPVLIAYVESDKFFTLEPIRVMYLVSSDHGLTWTALPNLDDRNVWISSIVTRGSRALIGNQDWVHPRGVYLPYDHIVRSDDVGATWVKTVSEDEFPQLPSPATRAEWRIRSGGFFTDDLAFMVGWWVTSTGERGMAFRSTDGGTTFEPVHPPGLIEPAFPDDVWGMGVASETTAYVASIYGGPGCGYRTLNAGTTWNQMPFFYTSPAPSFTTWVSAFVPCGNKVFAIGQYYAPPGAAPPTLLADGTPDLRAEGFPSGSIPSGASYRPTLWTSSDNGATWVNTRDPFPGLTYHNYSGFPSTGGQQKPLMCGLGDADGQQAVIAFASNVPLNNTPIQSWFRYTNNAGATWQTCTYEQFPDQQDWGMPTQICRAADGAWLAHIAYDGWTNAPPFPYRRISRADIWRGVPQGGTLHWTRVVSANDWNTGYEGTCRHGGVGLLYLEPEPVIPPPPILPPMDQRPIPLNLRIVGAYIP